jgi:hypothetical protein
MDPKEGGGEEWEKKELPKIQWKPSDRYGMVMVSTGMVTV